MHTEDGDRLITCDDIMRSAYGSLLDLPPTQKVLERARVRMTYEMHQAALTMARHHYL